MAQVLNHESGPWGAADPSLQAVYPDFCQNKVLANPGNVDVVSHSSSTTQPGIKAGLNRLQTLGIPQGSNLFLMPLSPFPSKFNQGWIWIWRSKMSWQDPHEHKAMSMGRKSSWEVTEPQALACPVKLSTWNLGKGKYLNQEFTKLCPQILWEI